MLKPVFMTLSMALALCGLTACDSSQQSQDTDEKGSIFQSQPEKLAALHIQEKPANYALPFCENKNCIEIEIQSIQTQDNWLNDWISRHQANVIQQQIGLKQNMSLQQAIDAYVKKSDQWQTENKAHRAYELHLQTRIASQRQQYVLLQIAVDSKQEELTVKDRHYFFVADRQLKKNLSILDVLQTQQQTRMNAWVQQHYQDWLKKQTAEVKKQAPKKLYWGQADWFFDAEGIGLHFRAYQIAEDATQLDIYFTPEQSQQLLKPEIYQQMF